MSLFSFYQTEYLSKCVPDHLPVKDQVYFLLRKTMADSLAANFNWKGRGKKIFSTTNLCAVVSGKYSFTLILKIKKKHSIELLTKIFVSFSGAILDVHKKASNSNVIGDAENAIKEWLKYAPKRAATKASKDLESSSSPTEGDP